MEEANVLINEKRKIFITKKRSAQNQTVKVGATLDHQHILTYFTLAFWEGQWCAWSTCTVTCGEVSVATLEMLSKQYTCIFRARRPGAGNVSATQPYKWCLTTIVQMKRPTSTRIASARCLGVQVPSSLYEGVYILPVGLLFLQARVE